MQPLVYIQAIAPPQRCRFQDSHCQGINKSLYPIKLSAVDARNTAISLIRAQDMFAPDFHASIVFSQAWSGFLERKPLP
jgi:hypothetical protein